LQRTISPDPAFSGQAAPRIELSKDDKFLYAVTDRGLSEIDTRNDQVVRFISMGPNDRTQCLGVSPSGRRVMVTSMERGGPNSAPASNHIVDVWSWTIVASFPRTRPSGEFLLDGCPAFRPDGKLIFLGRDMDLEVYLNRE
jgi:hypothetical protein